MPDGSQVREDQMKALLGEGLHPNADQITRHLTGVGAAKAGALAAARLGRPFRVNAEENEWTRRLRAAYGDYNTALGLGAARRSPTRSGPASAPPWPARCSPKTTAAHRPTIGNCPASSPANHGPNHRGGRVRPDVHPGQVRVGAVGAGAALDGAGDRGGHHHAVADSVALLEEHAAFTRIGTDGVAQVDTTGLIAAAFDHRDSRAGDPDLHTHVAVSNKVQTLATVRWLALDGTPLHKAAVPASERYNTRSEALLIERVGVAFADAADTAPGKRSVREIVGVATELNEP